MTLSIYLSIYLLILGRSVLTQVVPKRPLHHHCAVNCLACYQLVPCSLIWRLYKPKCETKPIQYSKQDKKAHNYDQADHTKKPYVCHFCITFKGCDFWLLIPSAFFFFFFFLLILSTDLMDGYCNFMVSYV